MFISCNSAFVNCNLTFFCKNCESNSELQEKSLWPTILRTVREQIRIVSRQNYFLFVLNRLPYSYSFKLMFCCNIMQCHSYWICFKATVCFYFVDVYFFMFCLSQCDKKDMRDNYRQTERFKVKLFSTKSMHWHWTKHFSQLVKLPLVLGVSDGCGQSLSTGFAVRLHRRQIALEVPSPSKGKTDTHTDPVLVPLSHTYP